MGKSSQPQTVTNRTELPAWLNQAAQENLQLANEIGSRPYTPYTGNLVAGFTPAQLQAQDMVRAMAGSTQGAFNQAQSGATGAMEYTPENVQAQNVTAGSIPETDISAYMNPYLSEVENRAVANAQRALKGSLADIGSKAARSGAFGGSRQGILEGVATAEAARNVGDLSAQLRQQGYNTAAGLAQSDINRQFEAARANQLAGMNAQQLNQAAGLTANQQRMAAAGLLGSLATREQTAAMDQATALNQVGLQQQALEHARLQDQYSRFMEQLNHPREMLNLRLAAVGATPYGQSSTQTRTGFQSTSPALSGIGSFLTGLAALGTF